jgi:hypothetical protein
VGGVVPPGIDYRIQFDRIHTFEHRFEPVDRQSFTTRDPHSNTSALWPAASKRPMDSLIIHPLPFSLKTPQASCRATASAKPRRRITRASDAITTSKDARVPTVSVPRGSGDACSLFIEEAVRN